MKPVYVPYKTLSEKREIIKDCLEFAGSICRKILTDKVTYPPKRPGEKWFYTVLIEESLDYLRCVENDYKMSINTFQIVYADGLSARVSVRFFETYITYFYDQDDYDHNTDPFDTDTTPSENCRRYLLTELLDLLDSRIDQHGGIYEIVFYVTVWGRVYPDKPFPIKVINITDILFIYSSKNDTGLLINY